MMTRTLQWRRDAAHEAQVVGAHGEYDDDSDSDSEPEPLGGDPSDAEVNRAIARWNLAPDLLPAWALVLLGAALGHLLGRAGEQLLVLIGRALWP